MNSNFPENFMWGAASSSLQIEGAHNEDGKCPTIWDVADKRKIKNGENCLVACDHYHRYKEDIALMKELGLKSYRFSVNWARIMPKPNEINIKGIEFYKSLVKELKSVGIEPLVTLFHWETPQWAQEMGGWKNAKICDYFEEYVKVVVEELSDEVTWWMTMNEPSCFIMNGYLQGVHAPFKRDYLGLNKLTRNCMVAHGRAVKAIRKYAKIPPKVGIAMATSAYVPNDESEQGVREAYRKTYDEGLGVMANKWWLDPMIKGEPVKAYGIYRTSKRDLNIINQPLDFLGVNVYTPMNSGSFGGKSDLDVKNLPKNCLGWLVDERVMYYTLKFTKQRYGLPILITENGYADTVELSEDGKVRDEDRIAFINKYLKALDRTIGEGVEVLGYQYWSIMDNFEWSEGYEPRFGLIHVDYKTQKRTLKSSAHYYKKVIESNGESLATTDNS